MAGDFYDDSTAPSLFSGGGISNVGVFSLGIVPYINSSIVFQILASAFPALKRLLKEEGEAGRRKFQQYIRYGALGLAVAQGIGQTLYLRPYAVDFDVSFFVSTVLLLVAGSQVEPRPKRRRCYCCCSCSP